MKIQFKCPECGASISVRSEYAGRTGKCPGCKAKVKIPLPGEEGEVIPQAVSAEAEEEYDVEEVHEDTLIEEAAESRRSNPERSKTEPKPALAMPTPAFCPTCSAQYSIPVKLPDSGKALECPKCKVPLVVPLASIPKPEILVELPDEDDSPSRGASRMTRRKRKMGRGLVLGLSIGGGALMLVLVAVAVRYIVKSSGPSADDASQPTPLMEMVRSLPKDRIPKDESDSTAFAKANDWYKSNLVGRRASWVIEPAVRFESEGEGKYSAYLSPLRGTNRVHRFSPNEQYFIGAEKDVVSVFVKSPSPPGFVIGGGFHVKGLNEDSMNRLEKLVKGGKVGVSFVIVSAEYYPGSISLMENGGFPFKFQPHLDLVVDNVSVLESIPEGESSKPNQSVDENRISLDKRRLEKIGRAFAYHAEANQGLSPASSRFTLNPMPYLSWRVHLLPFIGEDDLYRKFKWNEPWDSENNKKLIPAIPRDYLAFSSSSQSGKTYCKLFVGKGAYFQERLKQVSLESGFENTVLFAEGGDPVIWSKPDDFEFDPGKPLPNIWLPDQPGMNVVMCDGKFHFVKRSTSEVTIKEAILTRKGKKLGADW